MITKVGNKILKHYGFGNLLPSTHYSASGVNKGYYATKDVNGNNIIITPYVQYTDTDLRTGYYNGGSGTNARSGYVIGSDGTAPTDDDYTLGSILTTFTNTTSNADIYDDVNNEFKHYIEWTITATAPMTIREVGRYLVVNTASEIGGDALATSNNKSVLIARTVLDTPIELGTGESAILRFETVYA